jgi:hypothetical protein
MAFDGLELEHQTVRDRVVRSPFGHQCQDLALPGSQLVERRVMSRSSEQATDHLRIDDRSARCEALDGVCQLRDSGFAVD